MTSGHIKVKKGTGHVFYMATPSNATESVECVKPWSALVKNMNLQTTARK